MAFSRTYSGRAPSHKVVLFGESGVGKTSLLKRLDTSTFDEYQMATIGIEKCTTVMRVENVPVMVSKGVGTGGARGAMAPTLLKTVDFGPPTFQ